MISFKYSLLLTSCLCLPIGIWAGYLHENILSNKNDIILKKELSRKSPSWVRLNLNEKQTRFLHLLTSSDLSKIAKKLSDPQANINWEEKINLLLKSSSDKELVKYALIATFAKWAEVDKESALQKASQLSDKALAREVRREIFSQMVAVDPVSAAHYYENNENELYAHKYYFLKNIASLWCKRSPDEAWTWINSRNESDQNTCLPPYFYALNEQHPELMNQYVSKLFAENSFNNNFIKNDVLKNWAAADLQSSLSWLRLANLENDPKLLKNIIIGGVHQDFSLATSLLVSIPLNNLHDVVVDISVEMHDQQGYPSSLDWLVRHIPDESKSNIHDFKVLSDWCVQDPSAAKYWLTNYQFKNEHIQQAAIHAYLSFTSSFLENDIADLTKNIKNKEVRENIIMDAVKNWAYLNPHKTEEWLNSFSCSDELRKRLGSIVQKHK